ncbi:zinc-dependent metalloprotease, partial [Myxococcota bacterium]|nr:zinc-dependent metalloprotease [Myxococcota bacterium]
LRNSYIHWVDTPMQSGPLGYGPSSADPVTGEIIAAVANVYGASLETYAAYAADVVQLMNGDMVEADLEMGTYIRDGIEESRKLANANLNLPGLNDLNVLHDRMSGGMPSDIGPQATQVNLDVMKDRRTYTIKPSTRDDFLSYMGRADSKMEKLKGSQMEKELLIDEEIRRSLLGPTGYQPGGMAEWDASEFSPLELMGEEQEKRSRAAFLQATEGTIMYPEAWEDSGMLSLADDLKGKSWEDIYTFMLERTFYSVTVHEVGHTIGLRHNFEGSMDPLNYHAEYWDSYNMTTGKIDKVDDLGNPTGAEQYMYSSIMDYLPRFYADDLQGPGPYDVAAIKFGYGELIEVFDDETAALGFGSLQWLHGHENIPKMVTGDVACTTTGNCPASYITASNYYDSFSIHYNRAEAAERAMYQSEEDGNGALADDYRQEMLKEYDIAFTEYEYYSGYLNDYFLEALEGVTAKPENIWARHDISYESLRDVWTTYYLWSYYGSHYDNPPDEVPYAFCPDEYANYTNPSCQLWDKGASFWEVTQDTKERYDSYYYFANFKRDKYTFSANGWGWFSRVYRRYFSGLSNMFIYSLYSDMNMGKDSDGNYLTLVDFPVGAEWLMAGVDGMNTLVSVVNQPEPGAHCLDSATNTYMHMEEGETCTSGDTIEVPLGVGKYFYSNWTDEYYYKPTRQGVFWEKLAAVYALTTNEGFFYRDFSSYFDAGANSFSYWNGGFKEELLDLFYDAMTGTTGNFAWRYTAPAGTVAAKYASAPIVEPVVGEFDYNKPKIESSSSRTLRYYNTFLPMIRYNSAFDYKEDFLNYTKICIEGYGDCYDFALNETFYTDRTTGYIYKTSDTDLADKSISRRLLQEAEDFATDVFDPAEAAYDACVADCDDERAVYQAAESDLIMNTQFIDQLRMMGDLVD